MLLISMHFQHRWLRGLKVYDKAISPTGYDRNAEMMRACSGAGYTMQRVDVKDPKLPRILVVGTSISMGYRWFITEHFKGRAYVDYWVGGGWMNPREFEAKEPGIETAFKGVLSQGPYDVVSWNSMTLHMWKKSTSSTTSWASATEAGGLAPTCSATVASPAPCAPRRLDSEKIIGCVNV